MTMVVWAGMMALVGGLAILTERSRFIFRAFRLTGMPAVLPRLGPDLPCIFPAPKVREIKVTKESGLWRTKAMPGQRC